MRLTLAAAAALLVVLSACTTAAPAPTPVPEVVPARPPAPAPAPVPPPLTDEFTVSAEKKQASLAEIRGLVDKLNDIIARRAYSEWKTFLDQEYINTYGDPVRLKAYSSTSPFLKQLKINLKTLEDYFKFVVVPSRADVSVEDITFVDENRVKVWTVVDNDRVLLYLLKLYGKEWKISSW